MVTKSLLWSLLLNCVLVAEIKPALANVAYGTHPKQVLDVYKADAETPTPLLFFIHGGGWMAGDKANPDFLDRCLASGISVVSINYRFITDIEDKSSPPVASCLNDAARALQFTRLHAKEWNLDEQRIAGCGGSAGGFSCLWLAFHPDMANPKSANPLERESTRLTCAITFVPQTTLDPKQMREWIPNNEYGNHAFLLPSFDDFLSKRDALMNEIKAYSPYYLVSQDDPPVYLFYGSKPDMGKPHNDPPHSANFGMGLIPQLKQHKVSYEFNFPGSVEVKNHDMFNFILEHLKK